MRRLLLAVPVTAAALLVGGCGSQATGPGPAEAGSSSTASPSQGQLMLADYGLETRSVDEVVDSLDRLPLGDRPAELIASVRPDELLLSRGRQEVALAMPEDRFYLSVAPYVDQTHDCFHHSLTTCQGELAGEDVHVEVVDADSGEVLLDEDRTTFANGFVGLWLPRDIRATLRVTQGDRSAETVIGTGVDDPTCLTSLRLV